MPSRRSRPFRPRFEALEVRAVPAALYVAKTGSDANPGTAAAPWLTLQKAANAVRPGDTVVVRAGDYAGFQLSTDGTAAARITFRADAGVRVTTPNPVRGQDGINLEGASFVTIDGFKVINQPRTGIRSVLNDGVEIRNNVLDNNGRWGVLTGWSENVLIENNVASRSRAEHGIYVSNSADRPVIRGNVVTGNRASGIQLNADGTLHGDGIITGAVVENNVIDGNGAGGGASINCDGVRDSVIRNNLVTNAHASGIVLYRFNGSAGSADNLVVNNTVLLAADGRWVVYSTRGSTGNVYRNNILYSGHPSRGAFNVSADSLPGLVSDTNAVEGQFTIDDGAVNLDLAGWRARTGQDGHSFAVTNPAVYFVNPAAGDYHLKAGAAVVDAGTADGAPAADLEGTPRPSGAGVDIGHDERAGGNTAPSLTAVADQTVPRDGTTGPLGFAVADAETPAGSLTVTATSSDLTLLPASGIVIGGSGAARTVTVTPAVGLSGATTITLTVTDAGGLTATRTFRVTVSEPAPSPPPPPPTGGQAYAVGTGAGPVAAVTLYNPDGTVKLTATPFGTAFKGGVRVAVGDVTGDGVADVVAGTNGGITAQLRVVDGATGAVGPNLFGATYYSGVVAVAAGDVDGDGVADIAVGFPAGGAPRARVVRGRDFATLADFAAGPAAGYGGYAEVALADVTGDGQADLAVSGGYAAGARLFGWDGATLRAGATPAKAFADQALPAGYGKSVYLAAGDANGDGFADLAVGAWGWGNGRAAVYSGKALVQTGSRTALADFAPAGGVVGQGVRVGLRDVDGDGKADLVTGSGRWLTVYGAAALPPAGSALRRVDTGLAAGVYVG